MNKYLKKIKQGVRCATNLLVGQVGPAACMQQRMNTIH
jgi:hypothetical protein